MGFVFLLWCCVRFLRIVYFALASQVKGEREGKKRGKLRGLLLLWGLVLLESPHTGEHRAGLNDTLTVLQQRKLEIKKKKRRGRVRERTDEGSDMKQERLHSMLATI